MGGSEKVVYDIVRKLDRERYMPVIVGFEDGSIRERYEKMEARVYVMKSGSKLDYKLVHNLRNMLLDEGIDIINPHHFTPLFYSFLATRLTKVKLVYTEHSRWQLEQLARMKSVLNRLLLSRTDAVVAISKQIEDYYRNVLKLKGDKIHFITNGIDLALFETGNGKDVRHELGVENGERLLGTVANLRPEKNHKLLISAFSRVAKELENIRLVLVGFDCMGGEIQRFAAKSGVGEKILFLGQRDDVPELLRIFDIFCLTSVYEGLPLTVLEAMASGVPVIGANVLGINEVIRNDTNGLLFPKNDEKRLADLMKRLLMDGKLRERLSKQGRSYVEKYYNLDDKIKEYDELFQTVCKGN